MRVIDQMLRETAEGTDGINYFDHGPEPYAAATETQFPRIWVYGTGPEDFLAPNHSVKTQYNVLLEITELIQLSATTEEMEAAWERCQKLWIKFINRLSKHPLNQFPIEKVSRVEIVHKWSHNVVGYICTFTVKPLETPEYQCP